MQLTIVPLSDSVEARYRPVNRLRMPFYVVGIYHSGVLIEYTTMMGEQGCLQWVSNQRRKLEIK